MHMMMSDPQNNNSPDDISFVKAAFQWQYNLIAMGGAVNSVAEGAAGLYTNPASAAVRPETEAEKFAWNVYFNSYVPVDGQDSNNNGQAVTSVHRSLLGAAGLLLQYGPWGLTLDGGYTAHEIAPQAGGGLGVRSFIPHVALARTFAGGALAAGVGLRGGALNVYTLMDGDTLFTRFGLSGEGGVVWKPREQDFRAALSGALPVHTGAVDYRCDPTDCGGYILPSDAVVPWSATVGGAWRFGPTPWNHEVGGDYRDERQLTVAVDLTITGSVGRLWHGGVRGEAVAGVGPRRQLDAPAGTGGGGAAGLAAAARRLLR